MVDRSPSSPDAHAPSPTDGWFVVRDACAASALDISRQRHILQVLLGTERTASGIAHDLGITVNAAYLGLRNLVRVGLVTIAREQKRGGRAIKHYTAVAPRIFVPFELSHDQDLETSYLQATEEQSREFVRALLATYRREWGEPRTLGTSLYRDEHGNSLSSFGPVPGQTWSSLDADRPATVLNHGAVWLSPDEAKTLQRQLYELHTRHAGPAPGRRPYLLTLALTPADDATANTCE